LCDLTKKISFFPTFACIMKPSGIDKLYIRGNNKEKFIQTEDERREKLYPPEVVYDRYWKGGYVKDGAQPHKVDALPLDPIPFDWTIRSLYPALPREFKCVIITVLIMRNRKECPLSVLPSEVLLYLMEFTIPIRLLDIPTGLFEWLGTEGGTHPFSPPTHKVACSASSMASEGPQVLVSKKGGQGYTNPIPNSWVQVDLRESGLTLCCTHYSYSTRKYGGTPRALRNWEFQASNDAVNWYIISKHVEDYTIRDESGESAIFEVYSGGRFFSVFRIVQTGPNAYRETGVNYWQDNYAQLNFGNMELFGCIIDKW